MKKQGFIILFFLLLTADLIAIETHQRILEYIAKPLLMPVLALCFFSRIENHGSGLKGWILAALFFSLGGDSLLMLQDRTPSFFLYGLVSFLLAHICYIIFYGKVRQREKLSFRPALVLPVILYYAGLIAWLNPGLGEMRVPVWVYGVVISTMLILAFHMVYIRKRPAGIWMVAGASLFIISDSLLAINKFGQAFAGAGLLVMFTYGLAQFAIVKGAADYISPVD